MDGPGNWAIITGMSLQRWRRWGAFPVVGCSCPLPAVINIPSFVVLPLPFPFAFCGISSSIKYWPIRMFFVGAPPFCGAIFDAHSVPKCSVI
jgi:hypothetical protein